MKNTNTMISIKTTKIITATSISFLFLTTILVIGTHYNLISTFAQTTNETLNKEQQTSQPPSSAAPTSNQSPMFPSSLSTFVAGGNIGCKIPDPQGDPTGEWGNQENNYILTGGWELSVVNGTLEGFVTGFTMVLEDGSDRNTMNILKVISGNSSNITLQPQGTTIINGNFDVIQNGNLKWSNIPADITIHKANTISIMFQDQDALDYFGSDPIYGTIDTIFDPVRERIGVLK